MINPYKDVNWRPDRAGLRTFGRSLVIGFPIVGLVLLAVGRVTSGSWSFQGPLAVGGIGAGLGVVFVLLPVLARPFYVVWYGLACAIGLVISNALMLAVFYGVVSPVGLALRVIGRRPITVTLDRKTESYWITVPPSTDKTRYLRQF